MHLQDQLANGITFSLGMLKTTLADFSDPDMLVRPVPNANHATWNVGHLLASDTRLIHAVRPNAIPDLPAGLAEKFTKETASLDSGFPCKADLLALYDKQRTAIANWARTLPDADLDTKTPEFMQRFAPTLGALLYFMPTHLAMHLGQLQVIRRKLNKPILM